MLGPDRGAAAMLGLDPDPASGGSRLLTAAAEPTLVELYRDRVETAENGGVDVDQQLPSWTEQRAWTLTRVLSRRMPTQEDVVPGAEALG